MKIMKKNSLRKMLYLMSVLMLAAMVMVSCKKDDDDDDDPPVLVEDGFYVKGTGTALADFDLKGLMKSTKNEVGQEPRASLMEIFVAVKAGTDGFNIVKVAGAERTTHGPGADFALVPMEDRDGEEPNTADFWRGSVAVTDTKFTVPEDGLYHVVLDTELGIVVLARVKWGLIGAATPGGWSDDTELTATFDLNKMDFTKTEVVLFEDPYKIRYSNGWKIFIDADGTVKVNTNLGGSLSDLEPGGADMMHDDYGEFTTTVTWELGEAITANFVRTGDGPPLAEYPEAMFLVGAATAYGWDDPGTTDEALMHKLAGGGNNEGIFWKIAHLAANEGWKLAAENWGSPNLGFNEVDEFDAEGVEVTAVDGNMMVAESGMFMIVLNLRDDMVKVSVKPAEVYGIGDAFGGWDAGVEANKFTVDNEAKTITSPPLVADGNIRMYTAHAWIPDWWNAEFNVFEGKIEYRNDGGDQPAVPGTTGQIITLMFDDNTGTIE
jgi:hypothetical protein